MSRMTPEERIDALLSGVFRADSDAQPPLGFTGRVMAHVGDRQSGTVFSRMFWRVARPLLLSGWAVAGVLAIMAARGSLPTQATGMNWLVAGGSLLNYFTL
ncbi:hypothetical protein JCM15519_15790 [Fundidesulfovibrio butyratiphilus]